MEAMGRSTALSHGRLGRLFLVLLLVFICVPAFGLSVRDNAFNGVWQDWGNGWKYCYFSSGDTAWWKDGDAVRLGYQYGQGLWYDYGLGGWNAIGAKNTASTFIGDGKWYDLKNGWSFSYNALNDSAAWGDNNQLRLGYNYALGQWSQYGIGGWSAIGKDKVASKFIGDGGWYDLKNGWSYYYNQGGDTSWWKDGANIRFAYEYLTGQWSDYGLGGWNKIGATGVAAKFIGDGIWNDLKNGWTFLYNAANDTATWGDNNQLRLRYSYGPGQWWDYGLGGWNRIGGEKASSKFIGDGGWYDLKNGWSYYYNAGSDVAWWKDGSNIRFAYDYLKGQWSQYGLGGWSALGGENVDAKFAGDSAWHDLKNGWSYYYNPGTDIGWWKDGSAVRLAYDYVRGLWYDYGLGGWDQISAGGAGAKFIGDGKWYDLKNGWSFSYNAADDSAAFGDNNQMRFRYTYGPGQWYQHGIGGWSKIGSAKVSSEFIGDGGWYDLKNGWSYYYNPVTDTSWWKDGNAVRFAYDYIKGQWMDYGLGGWSEVGGEQVASAFIGDGLWHDLKNGWSLIYNASADTAWWKDGSSVRFAYQYGPGQWFNYGIGGWSKVGSEKVANSFVGDGTSHDVGTGWSFRYDGNAYWFKGGQDRLKYSYLEGRWSHNGFTGWTDLGNPGLAAAFIGDLQPHSLGNGWWYSYCGHSESSVFGTDGDSNARFHYVYDSAQWYDRGPDGTWMKRSATQTSSAFIGDGNLHYMNNGWYYRYEKEDQDGYWQHTGTERFAYSYDIGQWHTVDERGIWDSLSATGRSSDFIADGTWKDLLNGLSFRYSPGDQTGRWQYAGVERVQYSYVTAEWTGPIPGSGTWAALDFQDNFFSNTPEICAYLKGRQDDYDRIAAEERRLAQEEADRIAGLRYNVDTTRAELDRQRQVLVDYERQMTEARQSQIIANLNGRLVSLQNNFNKRYIRYQRDKEDINTRGNFDDWTEDAKWYIRVVGDNIVRFESYTHPGQYLDGDRSSHPNDDKVGLGGGDGIAWQVIWNPSWGSSIQLNCRYTSGYKGGYLDGVIDGDETEVSLANLSDGGIYWNILPQPSIELRDARDNQIKTIQTWEGNLSRAEQALAEGRALPPISIAGLDGHSVKLGAGGQWLSYNSGANKLEMVTSTDNAGTRWIMHSLGDGTVALESYVASQGSTARKWLDGQVSGDNGGVQLNSFGDGKDGTRWTINDNGIGYLQCVKDGSWLFLEGNRMINQQRPGGIWTISFFNQQEEGKPAQPNPINWKSPDEDIDWDATFIDGQDANEESWKRVKQRIKQAYKGEVIGNFPPYRFYFESGLEGIAQKLAESANKIYNIAADIIAPHGGQPYPIDVFILKPGDGHNDTSGATAYNKISDRRVMRKIGYIVLFAEKESIDTYRGVLCHETTHWLMSWEVGGTLNYLKKSGEDQYDYSWFTEALAYHASNYETFSAFNPTASLSDLLSWVKRYLDGQNSSVVQNWKKSGIWYLNGWDEYRLPSLVDCNPSLFYDQKFLPVQYYFAASGWFLLDGENKEKTHKVLDYMKKGAKYHKIEKAFKQENTYGKETGQEFPSWDWAMTHNTVWRDFYNAVINYN